VREMFQAWKDVPVGLEFDEGESGQTAVMYWG
jgi:hypothetical protein